LTNIEAAHPQSPPSKPLRTWLIVVTVVAAIAFLITLPSVVFSTAMVAGFGGDDPSSSVEDVMGLIAGLWTVSAVYILMLVSGVAGGWIAYRRRRNRLSFGLSLLAAAPIALIVLAILAVVIISFVWTASI